jgi:hypothetical protein
LPVAENLTATMNSKYQISGILFPSRCLVGIINNGKPLKKAKTTGWSQAAFIFVLIFIRI